MRNNKQVKLFLAFMLNMAIFSQLLASEAERLEMEIEIGRLVSTTSFPTLEKVLSILRKDEAVASSGSVGDKHTSTEAKKSEEKQVTMIELKKTGEEMARADEELKGLGVTTFSESHQNAKALVVTKIQELSVEILNEALFSELIRAIAEETRATAEMHRAYAELGREGRDISSQISENTDLIAVLNQIDEINDQKIKKVAEKIRKIAEGKRNQAADIRKEAADIRQNT